MNADGAEPSLAPAFICVHLRPSAANILRAVQDDLRRRLQRREAGGAEHLDRAVPAGTGREARAGIAGLARATLRLPRARAGAGASGGSYCRITRRAVGHGFPLRPADRSPRWRLLLA